MRTETYEILNLIEKGMPFTAVSPAAGTPSTSSSQQRHHRRRQQPQQHQRANDNTVAGASTTIIDDNEDMQQVQLPHEILVTCMGYLNWGELAKLACVQSQWHNVMYAVAGCDNGVERKWELAQSLYNGTNGLQKNPKKAMQLFLELATGGKKTTDDATSESESTSSDAGNSTSCFVPAMKQIATCYLTGEGVEEADHELGCQWLKDAHVAGDKEAAHELALIYEYSKYNVNIDVVEAFQWFYKAANDANHVEAMAELGLCYELGCGTEQSDENALEWYMKAAELGHVTAKYSVGEAFEEARGVPQSDTEACLWYYKAALDGDEDSRNALRRLYDIARIAVPGVTGLLSTTEEQVEQVEQES